MNDIDRYLDQACCQMNEPLRKELKEHLEEAIDASVAEGMSTGDAAAKAMEELGDPEVIRESMQSVYGPGVTSLSVEQAIKWKDRMWHLAGQVGLVLNVFLAILVVYFVMVKVVPKLAHEYQKADLELQDFMQAIIHVTGDYWFLYLIVLGAAVGFFELTCTSENKSSIRTFILIGLSLVSVVGAFWVALATMVSFALLPS